MKKIILVLVLVSLLIIPTVESAWYDFLTNLFKSQPLEILVGWGAGSLTFYDDHSAHVEVSGADCIGNPRGSIKILGPTVSEEIKAKIEDWELENCMCSYDGNPIGCGGMSFYYQGSEPSLCLSTGYIGDGVYCSYSCSGDIFDPDYIEPVTTTTPPGNGGGVTTTPVQPIPPKPDKSIIDMFPIIKLLRDWLCSWFPWC